MQIGDTHQVVVLEGLKDFLTDLAVQNLKEVIHAGVLIGHLQSVHQRSELRGTGRNTGEVQTAELALLDGGALVAQSPAKWHSMVMRPSVFSFTRSANIWQAWLVMCSALWLLARRKPQPQRKGYLQKQCRQWKSCPSAHRSRCTGSAA